jgi:hypothetical protein
VTAGISANLKDGPAVIMGGEANCAGSQSLRSKTAGTEIVHVDFANVQAALKGLIEVVGIKRLWLMIDEWSEVPVELQPYLADLIRRTCLPLQNVVVKIAAKSNIGRNLVAGGPGANIRAWKWERMFLPI